MYGASTLCEPKGSRIVYFGTVLRSFPPAIDSSGNYADTQKSIWLSTAEDVRASIIELYNDMGMGKATLLILHYRHVMIIRPKNFAALEMGHRPASLTLNILQQTSGRSEGSTPGRIFRKSSGRRRLHVIVIMR